MLCSDVVRVAGLEPASVYVKIVDTSTFLRNADLHLTCIFIFISKLAPYSPHIRPYFSKDFRSGKVKKWSGYPKPVLQSTAKTC